MRERRFYFRVFALSAALLLFAGFWIGADLASREPPARDVEAEMRQGRAMMRLEPELAAARALGRRDRRFLAVQSFTTLVEPVDVVWELRHGVRVVPGTSDRIIGDDALRYNQEAYCYAFRYNAELLRRLRIRPDTDARHVAAEVARCGGASARAAGA